MYEIKFMIFFIMYSFGYYLFIFIKVKYLILYFS